MNFNLSRTRLGATALSAFVGGLVLAGAFDLTPFSHAQQARSSGTSMVIPDARPVADLSNAFVAIAEKVTPAVVSIRAESPSLERPVRGRAQRQDTTVVPRGLLPPGLEDLWRNGPGLEDPQEAPSSGTGFIVSPDGYILTNNHVVTRNNRTTRQEKVTVTLNDGRLFSAQIAGNDPETDVAVLKIDANSLPTVALGDDNATKIGEWVLAIGNPLGLDFTVTAGIVSAKGRNAVAPNAQRYRISDFIQTDAAINPGNSGGPLLNVRGEVVGINSMIASTTGYYSGYGFAIPITLAKSIMDNLIANGGRIRASVLGVSIDELSPEDAQAAGLKSMSGVLVRSFPDDSTSSPAYKAGIRMGDVILAVNGKPMDRVGTLQRTVRSFTPGTTVDVRVMRSGEERTFRVRLEERTATAAAEAASAASDRAPTPPTFDRLGISVETVNQEWLQRNRVSGNIEGLFVTDIESGRRSAERLRGLIITDVMRGTQNTPIRNETDLRNALARMRDGDVMTFRVRDVQERPNAPATLSPPLIVNVRVGPE